MVHTAYGTQQQQQEEPQDAGLALPPIYYAGYLGVTLPYTFFISGAWWAWIRVAAVPPAPHLSTSRVVLGAPLSQSLKNYPSFGNLSRYYVAELCSAMAEVVAVFVGSVIDQSVFSQEVVTDTPSPIALACGEALGYTLTYPASIASTTLCLGEWCGWANLLPFTLLGRQYWAALPARVIERAVNSLIKSWLDEWLSAQLNINLLDTLGWLVPEPRDNADYVAAVGEDEDEEEAPQEGLAWAVKRWALSRLGIFPGFFFSGLASLPASVVFVRMIAAPGRYSSPLACAQHIWATEGLGGFFRDMPLALLPSVAMVLW